MKKIFLAVLFTCIPVLSFALVGDINPNPNPNPNPNS